MQTCRALAFTVLFYAWTTLLAIAVVPLLAGPPPAVVAYGRFWIAGALFVLRWTVGITHQVRGQERLPDGPVIVALKHQSAWDTMAINLLIDNPAIVLKKELLQIPAFGWCLRRTGHIAVDRRGGASALRAMVEQARARVAAGRNIVIFPEGTRTRPGSRQAYHHGVAALYRALDVPVVPVALNSGLFWPRRSLQMRPGTITVEFLAPIAPGLARQQFMGELEGSLEAASQQLYGNALQHFFSTNSSTSDNSRPGCG